MTSNDIHIYTVGKRSNNDTIECALHVYNESTAGADASVEVSKLHNIKLLAISNSFILTHIICNFAACILSTRTLAIGSCKSEKRAACFMQPLILWTLNFWHQ